MALPATFANSFFTPDPRDGVRVLWGKLEAGLEENREILRFVQERADAAGTTARALYDIAETPFSPGGFGRDDGASLKRSFEGIKYETAQNAKAQDTVARNLDHLIVRPFAVWSGQHEARVIDLRERIDESIKEWESSQNEVRKAKETRNAKCTLLDEAEEDLKFAPTPSSPDAKGASATSVRGSRVRSDSGGAAASLAFAQTTASQAATQAAHAAQQASATASTLARSFTQRIKVSPTAHAVKSRFERMRLEAKEREMASKGKDTAGIVNKETVLLDAEGQRLAQDDEKTLVERQQGRGRSLSTLSSASSAGKDSVGTKIDELEIAGVVKHPKDWSILFGKAKQAIPTTAVKVPLLGTTPDAHSGEDLVLWFRDNLEELGKSLSRSHEFCRQLSEELAILRLVGELGNKFYDSSDTFYAWRPEAFTLDQLQHQINAAHSGYGTITEYEENDNLTALPAKSGTLSPKLDSPPPALPSKDPASPVLASSAGSGSGMSRSGTLSSYLTSAYENAARNVNSLNARMAKVSVSGLGGDRLEKIKREADEAEESYRTAIKELDETRMSLEQLLHKSFSRAQTLEYERLKAVKSALSTYTSTIAALNAPLLQSAERTALLQEAFVPSSDLHSIIEQYRTGPFRPKPHVWINWYHEAADVRFGIDLRHWKDTHEDGARMPDILAALLECLQDGYKKLPSDGERRKTWIYEVPLQYTHNFRNMVNNATAPLFLEDIKKYDLPVLASAVKLWLLELAVALIPQSFYQDLKALYPSVGADVGQDSARITALVAFLERLPKIHLVVLDSLLSHLVDLVRDTQASEGENDSDYIAKLGAALGPCVVRPHTDSVKTLNDRFPSLFLMDGLKHYNEIFPPVLEKKNKVEEGRYAPKRQRTKLIDQRISRQAMQRQDTKGKERMLKEEIERRTGSKGMSSFSRDRVTSEPEEMVPSDTHYSQAQGVGQDGKDGDKTPTEQVALPLPPAAEARGHSVEPSEDDGANTQGFSTPPEASSEDHGAEDSEAYAVEEPTRSNSLRMPKRALQPEELEEDDAADRVAPSSGRPTGQDSDQAIGLEGTSAGGTEQEGSVADEEDLDKPLAASTSLSRSQTGSNLKRNPGLSSSLSRSRGPRPMSMHGTPTHKAAVTTSSSPGPAVAAAAETATSPTGSPLPAGAAGVRARAAMYEQRRGQGGAGTDGSKSPAAAGSEGGATSPPK